MAQITVFFENTKSKTGGHRAAGAAFIVTEKGEVVDARKHRGVEAAGKTRGVYSRGYREVLRLRLKQGEYAVQVLLVRNPRGWVKGWISVIDPDGKEVYRAVIRELKARYSKGDESYYWVAEAVLKHLGLHEKLRRINLARPGSRSGGGSS